jgi:isoleucyl-tRNA synthetase
VRDALEGYDATGAARRLEALVDDISNWYVRRSRRRFWDAARSGPQGATVPGGSAGSDGSEGSASEARAVLAAPVDPDKTSAYATLFETLTTVARLLAPFTPFIADELYRNLALAEEAAAPDSVHLTDYPTPEPALIDRDLEEAMAVARTLVSLGRTVRSDAKVKVRQPLSHALIYVPGGLGALGPLLPLVASELNVKDVRLAGSAEELAGWRAKPNFRVLGPKLGPRVQEVGAVLAGDDGAIAASLAGGASVDITLPSGPLTVEPGDVELVQQTRAGWALATDGPLAVALELELTDELRREGIARELIHHLQSLRKAADLHLTDRIEVAVERTADATGDELATAVGAYSDQIAAEVLATEVGLGAPFDDASAVEDLVLDGRTAVVAIRRAR